MLVLTVLEQTEDSESPVWSIDKANKLGLRKGRMKGLNLRSNYSITNALKAGHMSCHQGCNRALHPPLGNGTKGHRFQLEWECRRCQASTEPGFGARLVGEEL